MTNLDKAREKISSIDKEIAQLFEQRMDAVKVVAEYKKNNNLPIFDEKRENELLTNNCSLISNNEYINYYRSFQKEVMNVSKQYQQSLINSTIVAYQGSLGAFSHIASTKLFPMASYVSFPTFENVFQAVENGKAEYGIIPFENSYTGDVQEIFDWCRKYNCFIHEIFPMKIDQNLLVKKGTKLSEITHVYSHPQALNQCQLFLKQRSWEQVSYPNTALAAEFVSKQNSNNCCAIASKDTASIYNLDILEADINTSSQNTTRFIVISKKELQSASHFNMIFTLKHKAGQLAQIINHIAQVGYDMECIKSHPQKNVPWAYYFYVEIEADATTPKSKELINNIKECCEEFKLLGSYSIREE